MSSTKFSTSKQVEGHSSYVLHLIHEDSSLLNNSPFILIFKFFLVKKGNEARLLWGFISTHKQICTDMTCPLQRISLSHTSIKQQARNVINLTLANKEKIYAVIWDYLTILYTTSTSKSFFKKI